MSLKHRGPRVLLIPDSTEWILGTWAKEIMKWNADKYEFLLFPYSEIRENNKLFVDAIPNVDVIHCLSQSVFPSVKQMLDQAWGGQTDQKVVSTIHHIVHLDQVQGCLHADRIMVVCNQYLDQLVDAGIPREKLHLVYNGVDTDFFRPSNKLQARQKLGVAPGRFTIGFSAKASSDHDGRKGVDVLQAVLLELAARDISLNVIVTGPGWQERLAQVSSDKIAVHYFPYLPMPDMPDYYRALDVYLVTARVEGGPVPPLEAMSCGTAVITTPVGTMRDFIRTEENGLLVSIEDVHATTDAVIRLLRNPDLVRTLGSSGRNTIVQKLQWRNTVSQIDTLYGRNITRTQDLMTPRSLARLNKHLADRDQKRWNRQYGLQQNRAGMLRRIFQSVATLGTSEHP